jgi:hypothetical protein
MSLLLLSGLLYLIGISIILTIKPDIMFSKDGNWKEFGLGRNKYKYTWMPFWLFAIMWAIISYIIVLVISSTFGFINKKTEIVVENESLEAENVSMESIIPTGKKKHSLHKKSNSTSNEMKPGYYILNTNETSKKGIPKYIYLGPEAPNLIYNSIENKIENNVVLEE